MAAGDGTRWGEHLGVPKHLLEIDGEPLLNRLVRQFDERGSEVIVLAPESDPRYWDCGTRHVYAPTFGRVDTDKLGDALPWVLGRDRTTIVFGDCWLSERAVDALCGDVPTGTGELTWVGRAEASSVTGCPWGELFGVTVLPPGVPRLAAGILRVRVLAEAGEIPRGAAWEVYRATQGLELHTDFHAIAGDFVEVDDWSDDFDFPEDYDRWVAARAEAATP